MSGFITVSRSLLSRSTQLSNNLKCLHTSSALAAKRWRSRQDLPFKDQFYNPVEVVYSGQENRRAVGVIYDNRPFKVNVKKYHVYDWCGCGLGHNQPFCDNTCKNIHLKIKEQSAGSIKYIAPADKEVWFCNCKQTKHKPFCDGSHRSPEVRAAKLDGKVSIWDPQGTASKEDE